MRENKVCNLSEYLEYSALALSSLYRAQRVCTKPVVWRQPFNSPRYCGTCFKYEVQATKAVDNNVINFTMSALSTSHKICQCWGLNVGPYIDTDGL